MTTSVVDQINTTNIITRRIEQLQVSAAGDLLLIKEKQEKLLSEDFANSFTYEALLDLDAKRYARLVAVDRLQRALEWNDETKTPLDRLQEAIKWIRRSTTSYYPNNTSNISLEIDGRRHYAIEGIARELEDLIEYSGMSK